MSSSAFDHRVAALWIATAPAAAPRHPNAIAQRAVKLVAEGVGTAPVTASDARLAGLVSARSGGQPLAETLAAYLLLHGNAYVQVLSTPEGELAELFALRPERVTVEADASGWPAAYRYRVGERVTRLVADGPRAEVIHLKAFNPVDDHYGFPQYPSRTCAS